MSQAVLQRASSVDVHLDERHIRRPSTPRTKGAHSYDGGGGDEADRQALLAGRQPQPERNVRLAGAAVADRDHVFAASNVFAAGEFQDQGLVERGDRREVETVEAFHCREPRLLDAALDHPPFPLDQLEFGQAQQITGVIDPLGANEILDAIEAGPAEGRRYSAHPRTNSDRALWPVVNGICGLTEGQTGELVADWVTNGIVKYTEYHDQPTRNAKARGLVVMCRPGARA